MEPTKGDEKLPARKDWSAVDTLFGARIRHRRKSLGMSLKELAEGAGISISLLSQIERGISSPSLRVLAGLADALNLALGSLFDDGTFLPPVNEKIVVRADERKKFTFWGTNISKELLTPQMDESPLDIFLVILEPGGTSGNQLYSHCGEEGGLVLEGSIAINIDGTEHLLDEGDGFRFASTRQHSFRNTSPSTSRVLWVNARLRTDSD